MLVHATIAARYIMSDNRRAAFFAAEALHRLIVGSCSSSTGIFFVSVIFSASPRIPFVHMRGYHCILYYAGARNNCCKIHGVFSTDQRALLEVLDDRERKISSSGSSWRVANRRPSKKWARSLGVRESESVSSRISPWRNCVSR